MTANQYGRNVLVLECIPCKRVRSIEQADHKKGKRYKCSKCGKRATTSWVWIMVGESVPNSG